MHRGTGHVIRSSTDVNWNESGVKNANSKRVMKLIPALPNDRNVNRQGETSIPVYSAVKVAPTNYMNMQLNVQSTI